jgi:hypothetical protein
MKKNKGYTLLFAVLISSLVLGVAVSILNIARKELILTSGARESQYAFYAADTGYECAEWYDQNPNANGYFYFATTSWTVGSPSTFTDASDPTPSIKCISLSQASPITLTQVGNAYQFAFSVPLETVGPSGKACADIIVSKEYKDLVLADGSILTNILQTTIDSKGYNVGWNTTLLNCSGTSPKKVERALLIKQ